MTATLAQPPGPTGTPPAPVQHAAPHKPKTSIKGRDFSVGTSIPANMPHAVSVSLPLWQDNVDYEEGRLAESMETGYPRFFIHKTIQKLAHHLCRKFATPSEKCILLPTAAVADRCRAFMRAQSKDERPLPVRIVQFSIVSPSAAQADPSLSQQGSDSPQKVSLHIVLFPTESFPLAKAFWQHTGDGISSRMAERCLRLLEEAGSLDSPTGIATPTAATEPATVADETSPDPPRQLESHRSYSRNHHYKSRYAAQPPSAALGPTVSPVTHSFPYEGVPTNNPPTPAAPSAPAAINATLEEDPLTADHATYVEERYGRNLPIASSSLAKRALRRRIAGTLLADRQEGSSEAAETGAEVAETTRSGTGVTEEEVYLFPSGMSAIFHAHQVAMLARVQQLAGQADGVEGGSAALTRGVGKSVCFGFPYTDTLKILQKWGPGCHFYGNGLDADIDDLEILLSKQNSSQATGASPPDPILALFCEFPSNPLLRCPDLPRLRRLADEYGFVLVVDETIGNFVNVEVLPYADMVVSSLTKVFSGETNVMGGSLVLNPRGPRVADLRRALELHYEDTYWGEDAIFMERNSRDFVGRVGLIDQNAEALCDLLDSEASAPRNGGPRIIKEVFFPKFVSANHYLTCRRQQPLRSDLSTRQGFGGLFSVTFTSPTASEAFYDALRCAKGPSLGTNFTLASPYTILAHYGELEWAEKYGVERGLVRVSVGLEETGEVVRMFEDALEAARKAVSALS